MASERYITRYPVARRRGLKVFCGFPAPYRVAMSNLGFHFLFHTLRETPDLDVERFFADSAPFTVETGSGISAASILLFSISYEEDYVGLVRILENAGIEPLRSKRSGVPIVIAGGAAVSGNPMPLAGIVDAAVLGEGENPLGEIITRIPDYDRSDPSEFLEGLAHVPGVYVPALQKIKPRFSPRAALDDRFPRSAVVTPNTIFGDTLLVEIGRGCPGACHFCLARSLCGPFRHVSAERITSLVSPSSRIPVEKVGLVSTAVAAHPDFEDIVRFVTGQGISVSFSSLRVSDLGRAAIAAIASAGTRSVSLAPESGSERVRYRLGKRVPDETYFDAASRLGAAGIRHFNLYLLAGCPGEGPESSAETTRFLKRFKSSIHGRTCSVHVNIVVPKAWTPLQFYPMPAQKELEARLKHVRNRCGDLGLPVKTKTVRSAMRQAVLSLGDEKVGYGIVRHITSGVSWKKAMSSEGVDLSFVHEERGMTGPLPWDIIEGPVTREILAARYKRLCLDGN